MKRARVLLADSHQIMLDGLRDLLEPSCQVVGMVDDADALAAVGPIGLKYGEDVPAEARALSDKIHAGMAQLVARGFDVKVTKEGEEEK